MTDKRKFGYRVAIFNPTSLKGKEMQKALIEFGFPCQSVKLIDSEENLGTLTDFDDEATFVSLADMETLTDSDIVFFCGNPEAGKDLMKHHEKCEFFAFDLNEDSQGHEEEICFVSGINDSDIKDFKGVFRNPHSATIPIVRVLKPLDEAFTVRSASANVMTAVSEKNFEGINDLHEQTAKLLSFNSIKGKQLAFNIFPRRKGYSELVSSIIRQVVSMSKIKKGTFTLSLFELPIFFGTVVSLYVEVENRPDKDYVWKNLFRKEAGFAWEGDLASGVEPMGPIDIAESDNIHIQLLRNDVSESGGFWLWILADNVRGGSVLNMLNVAQTALELSSD